MGFVRNDLIYLNLKEMTKTSYSLGYTSGSSRDYFPYLELWTIFQINKFVEKHQVGDSVSHSLERILCINM